MRKRQITVTVDVELLGQLLANSEARGEVVGELCEKAD
jgi:hypothetical protein